MSGTIKKSLIVGNAAKMTNGAVMRNSLKLIIENLLTINAWGDRSLLDRKEKWIVEEAEKALAAPVRNCDRADCQTREAARTAYQREWFAETGHNYVGAKDGAPSFAEWLFLSSGEERGKFEIVPRTNEGGAK